MSPSLAIVLCVLGAAQAAKPPVAKTSFRANATRQPTDKDHFVDEIHDNAEYHNSTRKPVDDGQKDFVAMDRNGNGVLDVQELMYRQFITGCEPFEAQVRAQDYMTCADLNKDRVIDASEFKVGATKPEFAECIKQTSDRRAHGFVRFFDADADMDGFLTPTELRVGLINLWGQPGEVLSEPLMKCADKDKDGKMDQHEFHDIIATYNPMTREWQMWSGTSDRAILTCMKPAFAKFDAALVFYVTDTNKDNQISKGETYDLVSNVAGSGMQQSTANDIFKAADTDKNGFLNLDEFEKAGASYEGPAGTNTSMGFYVNGRTSWPTSTYDEGYGMSVPCHNQRRESWRVFSDDMGKVKVTPKKPWTGNVTVKQR